MISKYPCRRKGCANKQVNGRCRFEGFSPTDEDCCQKYIAKEHTDAADTESATDYGRLYFLRI